MNEAMKGLVRHLLTIAGGALVASGHIDEATAQQVVGVGVTVVGIVWSIVDKRTR